MPDHGFKAGEMNKAEVALDAAFQSGNEAAKVVEPSEQPLHVPAPFVAAQRASVLRLSRVVAVGRDQLDAVFDGELPV